MFKGLVRCEQQRKRERREKKKGRAANEEVEVGIPSLSTIKGWFRGKSFFLFTDDDNRRSYICNIPASWLEKSLIHDLLKKSKKNTDENLLLSAADRHNLSHPLDQPRFALPQTRRLVHHDSYANLLPGLSAWASLGSTIYLFGGHKKEEHYSRDIYYIETDVGSPQRDRFVKKCGFMVIERMNPKVVALDGKIYIFGGEGDYGDEEMVWIEIFEPLPHSISGQCRALPSPQPRAQFIDAVVALEKERKIIMSCDFEVYEFDVDTYNWVKIALPLQIHLRSPYCRLLAVGSVLYWLDTNLVAYDLESKQIFMGPIEDTLLQSTLENPDRPFQPKDFQVSLIHLGGEFFHIVWIARGTRDILHFTMIRVVRLNSILDSGYNLQASVLSCQTLVSPVPLELKEQLLMV